MSNNNKKSDIDYPQWVIRVSKDWGWYTGTFLIIFGVFLSFIPSEGCWKVFLASIGLVFSTFGSTILAVAVINISYQQWKDSVLENKIECIPERNKEEIKDSIVAISEYSVGKIHPVCPIKWYLSSAQPGKELACDLKNALDNSETYSYTGIGMSSMARIIKELNNKTITLIIPNPADKNLNVEDKNAMKGSIEKIIDAWTFNKTLNISFILLDYIPPFHIHLTDNCCWFAFVDKGKGAIETDSEPNKRDAYPTTYLYKKNKDYSDDTYEMYYTVKNIYNNLKSRHENSGTKYTFNEKGLYKITVETRKGKNQIIKKKETIENFLKMFNYNEQNT